MIGGVVPFLTLLAATARADTPVVVELRGANVGPAESIVIRFIGDDASVVEVEVADNGRAPDFTAEDGTWSGRGEIEGDAFQIRLVAGSRSMPATRVVWEQKGNRHLLFVVRGNELDAYPTIETQSTLAAAAELHRERWGAPFFWVVVALVGAIAGVERWGARGRIAGLTRLATPPVLDGSRLPRGAVRVEVPEAVAPALVLALVEARTVIVVGAIPVPSAAPGRVLRLKSEEPERLAGVIKARGDDPVAVVVCVPESESGDWLDVVPELPVGVPVFVLLRAGELPPALGVVNGSVVWLADGDGRVRG